MTINPAMLKLLLKSANIQKSYIDLFDLIAAQGFGALQWKKAEPTDPLWDRIKPDPARNQTGIWLRAEGPTTRITAAIFLEGVDDEDLEVLTAMGNAASLPAARF